MRWPYPTYRCRKFPNCGDPMIPYCLILYKDQDEAFRSVVKKHRLDRAHATLLVQHFMGRGVCMSYQPLPAKLKPALRELEKLWR